MGCCSSEDEERNRKRRYPSPEEVQKQKLQQLAEDKAMIDDMFDKYDVHNRGLLGKKELIEMITVLSANNGGISEKKSEKYVDFLLRKADTDKDGLISKSEFFQFYKKN